jgi:hypothetical protein
MEEYEKNDTSIRILYGRDPLKGVYLSVYDQRLTSKDETSGDLKKAVKKSGTTYRNGAYFDLRTGEEKP